MRRQDHCFGSHMRIRSRNRNHIPMAGSFLALLFLTSFAFAKRKSSDTAPFQYVGGTENLPRGCAGKLEVIKDGLNFTCPLGSVQMPFAAITLMQYRPDVSRQVMKMNLAWKVEPRLPKTKDNLYLTVLYNAQGTVHAVVLRVESQTMSPYLAEIELQSGKSVQVYRSYEEF